MTVEVWLDGKKQQGGEDQRRRTCSRFDNTLVLDRRRASTAGKHTVELTQDGHGPALLQRLPHQLHARRPHHQGRPGGEGQPQVLQARRRVDKTIKVAGGRGPGRRPEGREVRPHRARRTSATLKSGDLVEIELEIDSKNDYEYLMLRGHEGRRLRAGRRAQRLQRQRPGRLHGAARRTGRASSSARWPAASTASATACGPRSPASSAPCRPGPPRCTPRS